MSPLPTVLAGPILRRIEPGSVSVWIALRDAHRLKLTVLEGDAQVASGYANTAQLAEHLHMAVVTALGGPLTSGTTYGYTLTFEDSSSEELNTVLSALAYRGRASPTFSISPDINKLHLVHGSCRKPHGQGADALAVLDRIIEDTQGDPDERPHQLFLTGDQIYADDVADPMLWLIHDLAGRLGDGIERLPGDPSESDLRPGRRAALAKRVGLTAGDDYQKSQLMRLREYYAMYLLVWGADGLWTPFPQFVELFPDLQAKLESGTAKEQMQARITKKRFDVETSRLQGFYSSLSWVRRALANVSTYMAIDDHEVTDDWYLNAEWCQGVLGNPLGFRIIQNALCAAAVFQCWGNDPAQFADGKPGRMLLTALAAWRPDVVGEATNDEQERRVRLSLGMPRLDAGGRVQFDGRGVLARDAALDERLAWHYRVQAPKHEVLVLDTRTLRSYPPGPSDPARLIEPFHLRHQFPPYVGAEVTVVVSPSPVVTFPLADLKDLVGESTGLHLFLDSESWGLQQDAFETLIAQVAQRGPEVLVQGETWREARVVILSGDVHYSFTSALTYWGRQPIRVMVDDPLPPRSRCAIVQLTASPLKNQDRLTEVLHDLGFAPERFAEPDQNWAGWPTPQGGTGVVIDLIDGMNPATRRYLASALRLGWYPWKLRARPAVLYVDDHPFRITVEPAWRYRKRFIVADIETALIAPTIVPDPSAAQLQAFIASKKNLDGYRGQYGSGKECVGRNSIAQVRFTTPTPPDVEYKVRQDIWWRADDQADALPLTRTFTTLQVSAPTPERLVNAQ